jgi:hypothetical protein
MVADVHDQTAQAAIEEAIDAALLRAIQEIVDNRLLDPLPRESTLWLGVSSARDWYDHVVSIEA